MSYPPQDGQNTAPLSVQSRFELLNPLTAALLECNTSAEVVSAVVERGVAVLGANAGLVALVTRDGEYLEIIQEQGYSNEVIDTWRRFPLALTDTPLPLSDAVRNRTALFFTGTADWQARYPEMMTRPTHTLKASVSLPLIARGRAFGGLHFSFPEERESFSEADRSFFLEVARQCALGLERALLLEELEAARASAEAEKIRDEFLARASALLAESLDYLKTLDAITRLAVPDLCDWAAVDMVDTTNANAPLLHLAVAHANPDEVAWVREAQRRYPVDMTQVGQPIVHVLTTGKTVLLPHIPEDVLEAAATDEEHLRLIRKLDLRSYLCAPLTARGKILGAVTFASTRASGRIFTTETQELIEELSRRAAIAVDNARLYEQVEVSEQRYRSLFDQNDDAVFSVDREGIFTSANAACIAFSGYSLTELLQMSFMPLIVPEDLERTREHFQRAAAGEPQSYEIGIINKEGHRIEISATNLPIIVSGEIVGVFGIAKDITHRKRAEQALQSSEARYQQLLDISVDGVLYIDATNQMTYANPSMAKMLLYDSPEEMEGQSVFTIFFEADIPAAKARREKHRQGLSEQYEARLRRKDGTECWVLASVVVMNDPRSNVYVGTYTMAVDITERKLSQLERERISEKNAKLVSELQVVSARQKEVLRESEERFRLLVEGVKDYAIFLLDPEGHVATWNAGAAKLKGYTADEIIGQHFSVFYTEEDILRRHPWKELEIATSEGRFEEEGWRIRKDGSRFLANVIITALYDDQRNLRGFGKVTRDVTDRREREQARSAIAIAEQQRRFLKDVLASVTQGKLILCDTLLELPIPLNTTPEGANITLTELSLNTLRARTTEVATVCEMPKARMQDFITAVSEGAMNAVQHAGGGIARVYISSNCDSMQVWIEDQGKGIDLSNLPRATLERGYSTGGIGFGHGFWLMLQTTDRVSLLTGATGTTIVLEQQRDAPEPSWLQAPDTENKIVEEQN